MKKKLIKKVKLQFIGGEARPGPNLASAGINIKDFCNEFNNATQNRKGEVVPVVIEVFGDKSFTFVLKTTPAAVLIKKFAKIDKAAANSKKDAAGSLTDADVEEIAKIKMPDLNTQNLAAAKKTILGTMKQMGVTLKKTSESDSQKIPESKNN